MAASLKMEPNNVKTTICKYCHEDFPSTKARYSHQVDMHWRDLITQCEVCVKGFLLGEEPDPSHQCHLQKPSEEKCPQKGEASIGTERKRSPNRVKRKKEISAGKESQRVSQQMVFKCEECSQVSSGVLDMLNHTQCHHTPATQCHYCHLSCQNEHSLAEHLRLHVNQRWHSCAVCFEGFDRNCLLMEHTKMYHPGCDSVSNLQQNSPSGGEIPPNCDMEQDASSSDKNSTNRETTTLCLDSSDTKGPKGSENPEITGRTFSCRYCLQKFSEEAIYHQHVQDSHPKKYDCEVCGRRFVRRCEVKLHMKHHNEDRNYDCQYCAKSFKRQTHLDCHVLSHTGEKKFQCKVCGKAYKAKRTLIGHEMKHMGKQPYQCKDCGVKFTLKSSLLKHEESHSQGRARVHCPKCDKDFCSKESLVIHNKAIHLKIKQFVCETCGSAFAYQSHLKKHQMVHRNEKPFKCNYCEKCFRRSYSLMLHERQHTGQKPFNCSLCSKAYATRARLERHRKTHTKPSPLKLPNSLETQVCLIPFSPTQETDCDPHLNQDLAKLSHQNYRTTHHSEVIEEQQPVGSTVLVCSVCTGQFPTYDDLLTHQESHTCSLADTVGVMLSFITSASQTQ